MKRNSFFTYKGNVYFFLICLTLILLFILVGLNYFASKSNIRFDLTRQKQHTISGITKKIIQNLKQDVKMTAFCVGVPPNYIEDMLKEYERFSNHRIKTEIIDPLVQIGYASQFGNVISGDEKKIFVTSLKEKREIDFREKPLSEEMLTNAVVRVTREKRKVYFLAGHGEYSVEDTNPEGFSKLKTYLEDTNCDVETLILETKGKVPDDCNVLIIAGPKNQIPKKDEDPIQDFLKKGGKALFLIESTPVGTDENPLTEADKLKNPSLNEILNVWGLKVGDDIVVDLENYAGQDVGCPVTRNYPNHKQIVNDLDYTFYIRPRSISFVKDYAKTIKLAPLVFSASMQHSWAETNRNLHVKFDENEDKKGPVTLAAVVWEPKDETKKSDTKIIVFGDADFVSNNFINQYSNGQIILNSVSWLSELENIVSIEGHNIQVEHLNLASQQLKWITIILVAMPLMIAGIGCFIFYKQTATISRE